MAFPTIFPNGDALPRQPCIKNIPLDGYELHLIRYHENRFGRHPHLRYYLYNLIMHHGSKNLLIFSSDSGKSIKCQGQLRNCAYIYRTFLQTSSQSTSCSSEHISMEPKHIGHYRGVANKYDGIVAMP